MNEINFSDHKEEIINALKERGPSLGINEPVTLVDGFISQPMHGKLSGSFVIGGPTIPMVMVVGKNSGRIYFFALKALLPDLEI